MNESDVVQVLTTADVVLSGHFVLNSGVHADRYVNKDRLYPHVLSTELLCMEMATRIVRQRIEVVVGPVMGAVILSYAVALSLSKLTGKEVNCVYAEKTGDGGFDLRRGYEEFVRKRRVAIVEDVFTTGTSANSVAGAVQQCGGRVVLVTGLYNRGLVTAGDLSNIPRLLSLVNNPIMSWTETECPLCAHGIPVNTKVGKGKEFLARTNR